VKFWILALAPCCFALGACASWVKETDAGAPAGAESSKTKIEAEGNEDPLADEEAKPNLSSNGGAVTPTPAPKFLPAALPLPATRTLFGLRRFLEDYGDAYRAYAPLQKEYKALFQAVAFLDDPEAKDLTQVRTRLRENLERAHWAFLAGVYETLDFLGNRSRDMLHIDKEKNFLRRMRVLAFLAEELDSSAATSDKYTGFIRELYKETSERHFGRRVKARGKGEPQESRAPLETSGDE
jgi:hypothetical protein